MAGTAWRVELELKPEHPDPLGERAREALRQRGFVTDQPVRSGRAYLLPARLSAAEVRRLCAAALADPVTETARVVEPGAKDEHGERLLVVRRHPGVADPEGRSAARALQLLGVALQPEESVESYRTFRATGAVDAAAFAAAGRRALANATIESAELSLQPLHLHPAPRTRPHPRREVPLSGLSGPQLAELSGRLGLALSGEEMAAIRDSFAAAGREPTDVELETLAQTWSEHCKHKTLTGPVRLVVRDAAGRVLRERRFANLLRETVFEATHRLQPDWCWSVFRDNAGVVELAGDLGVAIKVETHNHPSALEPYGGAGTGLGGVIRDVLGTGRGARPFAALDVFCVGPEALSWEALPPGTLHPDRVLAGVVAGVRDYGNRVGIPTVCGTVLRHPGYVANPLVFAGCLGEIRRDQVHKEVRPGDLIVAVGGRTGRDGIHGATFSSEALHAESEAADATAVQIGDPITEKKLLDALLQARDRGLFRALTDCGAGGFSSAVGEMGAACGAEVELETAPLKYPGLSYAEIWISEAQERMVLAVPPEHRDQLLELCGAAEVEAVVIGRFTASGRLLLRWHGAVVADLDMDFLHRGVPQPERWAEAREIDHPATAWPAAADWRQLTLRVLDHPSVASKESVVRQYDHEVQGGTVSKPYGGPRGRGPADGTVVKPRLDLPAGVALGCGIAPGIGELDPYAGAACAIDEAVRNVVAAGGDPHRVALLDNFCWGDCRKPDRLGSLARAAEACYDAALAYGAPFVSGKDSLNNEYREGGRDLAIPPTLLCTAVAPLADASRAVTTPLKEAGDLLLLLGATAAAGGGAAAGELLGLAASQPPRPDFEGAPACLDALHQAMEQGLVRACHDLSEGGLAAAAAEMVLGSELALTLDVARVPGPAELPLAARLYSETPTRFLLEIAPAALDECARLFRTLAWAPLGQVQAGDGLLVRDGHRELFRLSRQEIARACRCPP